MVLGPKSEERVKELLIEHYNERQANIDKEIAAATSGIFLWGFLSGVVMAYSGMWSFVIGGAVGYYISKKNLPLIDNLCRYSNDILTIGYRRVEILLQEK